MVAAALVTVLAAVAVPWPDSSTARALAVVPTGFADTEFATGFGGRLTTMTFSPDGRLFVSEKQGSVRIVKNGVLVGTPFLTVSTNSDSEKGLKGIAFDPAYASNGRVYVYYTDAITLKNKVSRFTTSANPDVANAGSEVVLLDGIDSGIFHSGGALHFGPDGKLYVSTGDASYAPNGQNLGNINGKLLRINTDGSIPGDNPFVGQAGRRGEIWAYGLRNPYTFAFQPGPQGRLFINDVGNETWEELNEGFRGANYGWPVCEGVCGQSGVVNPIYAYNHNAGSGKSITGAAFYTGTQFPAGYAGDYFFGDYVGNYIKRYDLTTGTVTDFATNALYPVDLDVGPDGALYYLSVESRKVHRIAYGNSPPPPPPPPVGNRFQNPGFETTGANWLAPWRSSVISPAQATFVRDTVNPGAGLASLRANVTTSSQDWHVQLLQPNIALTAGVEHTLTFMARASTNRNARVAFQRNTAPYSVHFQQSVALTTAWRSFTILLTPTVEDPRALFNVNIGDRAGQVWIDQVSLTVPTSTGESPTAVITAPTSGTTYRAGDEVSFSGGATDPEDGDLGPAALEWEVVFHHDTHTHPYVEPFTGQTEGMFTAAVTGETSANVWYRIHLRATDADGNTSEVTRDVVPLTSTVTLTTQPAGLSLTLDGSPVTAPRIFQGVINFQREIGAPATQTLSGNSYRFVSWSDGGAATHTIATPETNTTYTAVYEPESAVNLFQNPGFEVSGGAWLNPWKSVVRGPAQATVTRDTSNPGGGAASLRVNINAASQDWYVQVLQPNVPLVAGTPHTVSFNARASSARSIRVAFQQNGGQYPLYFQQSVAITNLWRRYTFVFTPTTSDTRSLFGVNMGANTGQVWLDDFSLTR